MCCTLACVTWSGRVVMLSVRWSHELLPLYAQVKLPGMLTGAQHAFIPGARAL